MVLETQSGQLAQVCDLVAGEKPLGVDLASQASRRWVALL